MPNYMVFLLFGIILIGSGLGTYYVANLSTTYKIPKGAMRIGIGPHGNMTPISTRIIISVSIPHDWIVLEVSFNFTELKKYHIYITMPCETLKASPYVIYQHYHYRNETSRIGNISANFRNFETKGSSVINATFIPNSEFPFLPSESVTLSIEARVSKLVSISYPLGSKQTVILTFFGDQTGVWDDAMVPYIGIDTLSMNDYPFQVIVQFLKENYLSSDTFPSPIELFVTERFRATIFDLDFSYPEGYAQSISCSYANPENESLRSLLTFLSGVFLTTGMSLCFVSLRRKEKPPEKPNNGEKERKGNGNAGNIEDLIELVDEKYQMKILDTIIHSPYFGMFVALLITLVPLELYLFSTHDVGKQLSLVIPFSAVLITFSALFLSSFKDTLISRNYKRLSKNAEENQKPLLKALIKMKTKESKIALRTAYEIDKTLFTKDRLLQTLYE